jgi:hypothetical protein
VVGQRQAELHDREAGRMPAEAVVRWAGQLRHADHLVEMSLSNPAVAVARVEHVDDEALRGSELSENLLRGLVVIDPVRNGQLGVPDEDRPDPNCFSMARIGNDADHRCCIDIQVSRNARASTWPIPSVPAPLATT